MKKALTILLIAFQIVALSAQTWTSSLSEETQIYKPAISVIEDSDGSLVCLISAEINNSWPEIKIVRLDQDGDLINEHIIDIENQIGDEQSIEAVQMVRAPESGFIILARTYDFMDLVYELRLIKISNFGEIEWVKSYSPEGLQGSYHEMKTMPEGGFIVTAAINDTDVAPFTQPVYIRFDAEGDFLSQYYFAPPDINSLVVKDIAFSVDNHIYASGSKNFFTEDNGETIYDSTRLHFVKTDLTTDTPVWQQTRETDTGGTAIAVNTTGDLIATEVPFPFFDNLIHVKVLQLNSADGTQEWQTNLQSTPFANTSHTHSKQILINPDGSIFLMQGYENNLHDNLVYGRIFADGTIDFLQINEAEGQFEYFKSLIPLQNGGYAMAGAYRPFDTFYKMPFARKIDADGNLSGNFLQGKVTRDDNANCLSDAVEAGVENILIRATNAENTAYAYTDNEGNYSLNLPQGTHILSYFTPSFYWETCEENIEITFANHTDVIEKDFSLAVITDCPALYIDLANPFIRNCFDNNFHVTYENRGTAVAEAAYAEIILPEGMIIDNTSIPFDDTSYPIYRFELGDISEGDGGSLSFTSYVDCEVYDLGQSLCFQANIYPSTYCLPTDNWSGASIEVDAECIGDTLLNFRATNVGEAATTTALEFIVIEDEVIMRQGDIPTGLVPTAAEFITVPTNGGTYRLEVDQEPNHPGDSAPSITVEGCGDFTPGFVNVFSHDDGNFFKDIECREIIGSFDPNDKSASPRGYGDENFILKDTELEYLVRFQNTGTDTAFRVVIRDTLTQFLDITSIRPGASSHPYVFDIEGGNTLKFTFNDIMLADSFINEPASHGFVQFKINQRQNNANGTQIRNDAAIFFDFNEPVITNQTLHTVGEMFVEITDTDDKYRLNNYLKISNFPNPFSHSTHFDLDGVNFTKGLFELYDLTGKKLQTQIFTNQNFSFIPQEKTAGIYPFKIILDGKYAASGRIIIQ